MKIVKDKIKTMKNIDTFEGLLEKLMISDENKTILRMIYKEHKPLSYIADILGYSEGTIKRRHKQCLKLIALNVDDFYI